jgi:hypothetical protein
MPVRAGGLPKRLGIAEARASRRISIASLCEAGRAALERDRVAAASLCALRLGVCAKRWKMPSVGRRSFGASSIHSRVYRTFSTKANSVQKLNEKSQSGAGPVSRRRRPRCVCACRPLVAGHRPAFRVSRRPCSRSLSRANWTVFGIVLVARPELGRRWKSKNGNEKTKDGHFYCFSFLCSPLSFFFVFVVVAPLERPAFRAVAAPAQTWLAPPTTTAAAIVARTLRSAAAAGRVL